MINKTNVSKDQLINWRKLSKLLSNSKSPTAIQRLNYPDRYAKEVEALIESVNLWYKEHVDKISPEKKFTKEEINSKLNNIQW